MENDIAGILFVEDFDTPSPRNAPGRDRPEIIAPAYTAEDVETAREEGRAAGLDEARADHQAMQDALCNAALAAIGEALATARDDASAVAERIGTALSGAILALLTAALPATAAKLAPTEIAALLAALLPPLSQTPGVTIRVHPDLLPYVTGQIGTLQDATATGDANLAPSDVAITWRDGHARRDWSTLWTGITAALAPFGLPDHLPDLPPHAEGSQNAG